jgi:protein-tyrosine-phosphatase
LREGILDAAALRRVAGLEIAFVCTGNTCRSPMAAGFARKLLAERLAIAVGEIGRFGFGVRSMGVYAHSGAPASEHAVDTMREQGIDLTGHRAACAVPEELAAMSRVYALTRSHLEAIRMLLPPGKDRHCALLDPGGRDVADPVGGTRADYEFAARQIRLAIEVRLDEWA